MITTLPVGGLTQALVLVEINTHAWKFGNNPRSMNSDALYIGNDHTKGKPREGRV
jgi:hypothetical protein